MSSKKPNVNSFNTLVASGELVRRVMSDGGRKKLLETFKELSSKEKDEAMAEILLAVQELQGNVEEYKKEIKELETKSWTGLNNKNVGMSELKRAIGNSAREVQDSGDVLLERAMLFFDADGLKSINDGIADAAGDAAIQAIADRAAQIVRDDDILAHVSGDEFWVVVTNRGKHRPFINKVLERYNKEFEGLTFEFDRKIYPLNVSIGAASINPSSYGDLDSSNPEQSFKLAAIAVRTQANNNCKRVKAGKGASRYNATPQPIGYIDASENIVLYSQGTAAAPSNDHS